MDELGRAIWAAVGLAAVVLILVLGGCGRPVGPQPVPELASRRLQRRCSDQEAPVSAECYAVESLEVGIEEQEGQRFVEIAIQTTEGESVELRLNAGAAAEPEVQA